MLAVCIVAAILHALDLHSALAIAYETSACTLALTHVCHQIESVGTRGRKH